jgi:predicted RNA-binding Zn-ribbon protein involved in translation (DUF1610 family)
MLKTRDPCPRCGVGTITTKHSERKPLPSRFHKTGAPEFSKARTLTYTCDHCGQWEETA